MFILIFTLVFVAIYLSLASCLGHFEFTVSVGDHLLILADFEALNALGVLCLEQQIVEACEHVGRGLLQQLFDICQIHNIVQ